MGKLVCNGALLQCSMGVAPGTLTVLPANLVNVANQPAATIMDHKPMVNVPTFGMCQSLANPTVASATSAAQGVLTPMPCIPNTVSPWTPGSATVTIGNMPALNDSSTLMCMWAGQISVTMPGQFTTDVP